MRIRAHWGKCKTTCSRCNNPLEPEKIGKYRYCKKCHAEASRRLRKKYCELSEIDKWKSRARGLVKAAVAKGAVIKEACMVCGDIKSQAHHEDYSKPLDVVWLCQKHHIKLHTLRKRGFSVNRFLPEDKRQPRKRIRKNRKRNYIPVFDRPYNIRVTRYSDNNVTIYATIRQAADATNYAIHYLMYFKRIKKNIVKRDDVIFEFLDAA